MTVIVLPVIPVYTVVIILSSCQRLLSYSPVPILLKLGVFMSLTKLAHGVQAAFLRGPLKCVKIISSD